MIEAKVLSDISCGISFDATRNQTARNLDVMLEPPGDDLPGPLPSREPEQTVFVLLTPELFRAERHTRHYGALMDEYRDDPRALGRDLPHRAEAGEDLEALRDRIGWLTWEDCRRVDPDACRWLDG